MNLDRDTILNAILKASRGHSRKREVNYPLTKGSELLVFASTEPLVLTQQNWVA